VLLLENVVFDQIHDKILPVFTPNLTKILLLMKYTLEAE
jgi:hypothetical protein